LIKADYICKKEKTQIQNVPESCLVAGTGFTSLFLKEMGHNGKLAQGKPKVLAL